MSIREIILRLSTGCFCIPLEVFVGVAMETAKFVAPAEGEVPKKRRQRKKQLYNSILNQMEFYFSDSNLSKDRFLGNLYRQNPNVDLNVFMKFNKIRKLTENVDDVRKALRKSALIEFSEDGQSISRKVPIKEKENVDSCTIYVERLQGDATHEFVSSVFSDFGKVTYVSIPKYKTKKEIKGFGFIEFETEAEAAAAVSYFESIGCKIPTHTDPKEIYSISSFIKENESTLNTEGDIKANGKEKSSKRLLDEDSESKPPKKLKTEPEVERRDTFKADEDEESEAKPSKKIKSEKVEEGDPSKADGDEESDSKPLKKLKMDEKVEESDTTKADGGDVKKKKKKENKKRSHFKELGWLVLSKIEWKKMRNRYLDLQKKKMREFKQYLVRQGSSQTPNNGVDDKFKRPSENPEQREQLPDTNKPIEFIPGVIVKVHLLEPPETVNTKKIKVQVKAASSDIKFVEVVCLPEKTTVFVRFGTAKGAEDFCTQGFNECKAEVLQGDEEKSYWKKLANDRTAKLKKIESKSKNVRGRDKLLKKANRMPKHIKFDD